MWALQSLVLACYCARGNKESRHSTATTGHPRPSPAIFGGAFQGHSRRLASSPPSSLRRRSLEALSLPPEAAGLPVHAARLQAWYANADVARNGFVVGGSCN